MYIAFIANYLSIHALSQSDLKRDFLVSFLIFSFSDGTKEKVEDVENAGGES